MLNTLGEIKGDVLVKLAQSTSAAFYTDDILGDLINEAYSWVVSRHKWPATEGRVSTTFASLVTSEDGDLRGDYPENWKSDSIRWMWIDQKKVQKTEFTRYRRYREDNPDASERFFTDYGRLYYINPNIDISGTITLWGQYYPGNLDLTDPDAITVFSNREEELNEAISEKVLSFTQYREKNYDKSNYHAGRAVEIGESAWNKIREEQQGYHDVGPGMWEWIDVTRGRNGEEFIRRNQWY